MAKDQVDYFVLYGFDSADVPEQPTAGPIDWAAYSPFFPRPQNCPEPDTVEHIFANYRVVAKVSEDGSCAYHFTRITE